MGNPAAEPPPILLHRGGTSGNTEPSADSEFCLHVAPWCGVVGNSPALASGRLGALGVWQPRSRISSPTLARALGSGSARAGRAVEARHRECGDVSAERPVTALASRQCAALPDAPLRPEITIRRVADPWLDAAVGGPLLASYKW
jgi:hypothetical protein